MKFPFDPIISWICQREATFFAYDYTPTVLILKQCRYPYYVRNSVAVDIMERGEILAPWYPGRLPWYHLIKNRQAQGIGCIQMPFIQI